jgi:hypothetical protein
VYPNANGALALAEGDYGQDNAGKWNVRPPGGHMGVLTEHEVTEHRDGTISVSPSILREPDGLGRGGYHGFLKRGEWSQC